MPKGIYTRKPHPISPCSIEGCEATSVARGWCPKHYQRWKHHGDPGVMLIAEKGAPPMERFMRFVEVQADGCALWTGTKPDGRYGRFCPQSGGPSVAAHRWRWEQEHGPVPGGMEMHHTCEVTACVTLTHLERLTHAEHAQRHLLTHCKHGHEFTLENTHTLANGERRCRTCGRETMRRYRARHP